LLGVFSTRGSEHARARGVVIRNAQRVVDAAKQHGRIVVFIHEPTREAYLFRRLFLFNERGLASNIIVARDRGPLNSVLIGRLPGHTPLMGKWQSGGPDLVLTPMR